MRDDAPPPEHPRPPHPPASYPYAERPSSPEHPWPDAPSPEQPAYAEEPGEVRLPWEAQPAVMERPGYAPGAEAFAQPRVQPLATYTYRKSVLEEARTYALDDEALWVWYGGPVPTRIPFTDIREVRLDDVRGRNVRHFVCLVKTTGTTILLRHQSYRGFADFEDQRAAYTPFVGTLLAQLAPYTHVHFRAGSALRFWAGWVFIAFVLAMGALMWSIGAAPVAGVCAFGAVVMLAHTLGDRPREVNPLAPPAALLPT